MAYTFKKYEDSEDTKKKYQAYQNHQSTKPVYSFDRQQELDDARDAWQNRGQFQYNMADDGMYQQMVDRYVQQGKMAMQDTVGQSAALTGGYGNTWAQNAGQQAYHGYLQGLNDMTPQLYQMALDRYQMEGENLYNQYAALSAEEQQAYGRHMDAQNLWQQQSDALRAEAEAGRNFDWEQYVTGEQLGYGAYRDQVADQQWNDQMDYQKAQDRIAQENWQKSFDYQKEQDGIANYYAQLKAENQTPNYKELSASDYETWRGMFSSAGSLAEMQSVADSMIANNINPEIAYALYDMYVSKFEGGPGPFDTNVEDTDPFAKYAGIDLYEKYLSDPLSSPIIDKDWKKKKG